MKKQTDAERDADLAAWCDRNDLAPDGRPLPAQELARRGLARQLRDEIEQAQRPKYRVPFYRLPFTRDI